MLDFYESGDRQLWLWLAGSAIVGLAPAYGIPEASSLRPGTPEQSGHETGSSSASGSCTATDANRPELLQNSAEAIGSERRANVAENNRPDLYILKK